MNARTSIALILSAALLASPTLAAEVAPLPAGNPAGTKQAALSIPTLPALIIVGSLVVAAVAGAGGFGTSHVATSTSGTSS